MAKSYSISWLELIAFLLILISGVILGSKAEELPLADRFERIWMNSSYLKQKQQLPGLQYDLQLKQSMATALQRQHNGVLMQIKEEKWQLRVMQLNSVKQAPGRYLSKDSLMAAAQSELIDLFRKDYWLQTQSMQVLREKQSAELAVAALEDHIERSKQRSEYGKAALYLLGFSVLVWLLLKVVLGMPGGRGLLIISFALLVVVSVWAFELYGILGLLAVVLTVVFVLLLIVGPKLRIKQINRSYER